MSAAAEQFVTACTHPVVKGSARALLMIIAQHIPEGQTTTLVMTVDDLAARARLHRRTVTRWLADLVEIGILNVVDGGRGRPARYEILRVTGARPITDVPLPLVGEAPRRRPSAAFDAPSLFDLADDHEETAINVGQTITRWIVNVGQMITRLIQRVIDHTFNVGQTITRSTQRRAIDHTLASPQGVDEYVHTLKNVHTHAPPGGEPTSPALSEPTARPRAPAHPWHAWCDGRVHVPKNLHAEFLGKMGRLPGESESDQEARLFAFYAQRCAAIPDDEPIGGNDYQFWRPAFAEAFPRAGSVRERRGEPRAVEPDDVWAQIRRRIETQVTRHAFYTWFGDSALVRVVDDVIAVRVPSDSHATWIQKHHAEALRVAVAHVRPGARVVFVSADVATQKYG